jgi:membrane protease YdiL (CAAX protease family)
MPDPQLAVVDYWADSKRPLTSLLFLLPWLGIYECGVLWLGQGAVWTVRNGADSWMRAWLLHVGLDRPWVLPALIVVALCGWHVLSRDPWRASLETFVGMLSESLLGAILLLLLGQFLSLTFRHLGWGGTEMVRVETASAGTSAIGFLGAGIYEEVLFRLLLLPAAYMLLRLWLIPVRWSWLGAILATSLLFAMAHYVDSSQGSLLLSYGVLASAADYVVTSPSTWFGFTFRLLAGVLFAVLFLTRGFGITVGCHALYDLLVGVLMAHHP